MNRKLSVDTANINTQRVHAAFLSAAGYASSSVLYNFGDPQFIHDVYAVGPFQVNYFCQPDALPLHRRWFM